MDVKIVFLNSNLEEQIHMNLPKGEGNIVYKHKRSKYGVKQVSRQ